MKNYFYIADFSLPNKSAYSIHVLKICDAFNELNRKKITLLIPHIQRNYNFKKIQVDYLLKFSPVIKAFYLKKIKLNFIKRIFFALKIYFFLKNKKKKFIISRSIVTSLILAGLNIKNILEIHTQLTGITKIFFRFSKINFINKNLKFIFINERLRRMCNIEKKKSIILYDAVDHRDFKPTKKIKNKKTCFYSGSFAKGKGVEIISKVAKILPEYKFHLYGNIDTLNKSKILKQKNIIFKGFLTYSKLVKVIKNYKVLLMPYQKKVGVLIEGINVAKYFSPLKMFDYMASGKIIIASELEVYQKFLINKKNSLIIKDNSLTWAKKIKECFKSDKYDQLGTEARKDSKNYSWIKRVIKIKEFDEK